MSTNPKHRLVFFIDSSHVLNKLRLGHCSDGPTKWELALQMIERIVYHHIHTFSSQDDEKADEVCNTAITVYVLQSEIPTCVCVLPWVSDASRLREFSIDKLRTSITSHPKLRPMKHIDASHSVSLAEDSNPDKTARGTSIEVHISTIVLTVLQLSQNEDSSYLLDSDLEKTGDVWDVFFITGRYVSDLQLKNHSKKCDSETLEARKLLSTTSARFNSIVLRNFDEYITLQALGLEKNKNEQRSNFDLNNSEELKTVSEVDGSDVDILDDAQTPPPPAPTQRENPKPHATPETAQNMDADFQLLRDLAQTSGGASFFVVGSSYEALYASTICAYESMCDVREIDSTEHLENSWNLSSDNRGIPSYLTRLDCHTFVIWAPIGPHHVRDTSVFTTDIVQGQLLAVSNPETALLCEFTDPKPDDSNCIESIHPEDS